MRAVGVFPPAAGLLLRSYGGQGRRCRFGAQRLTFHSRSLLLDSRFLFLSVPL